ncbi:hypothetical protein BO71DRAFT_164915 [Aspergillus ellipticus CBS 707.79]|uniref:Uncharacterized protein n=1 Tax=Aspergillus ellipticus CBS 707.79 TaxID=1448320 RepID=A0A319E7Q8_9EURO|nr:hypothetical protein BO71DRAFT_164915 [Aspergillus ellipticus CBS 707.79]
MADRVSLTLHHIHRTVSSLPTYLHPVISPSNLPPSITNRTPQRQRQRHQQSSETSRVVIHNPVRGATPPPTYSTDTDTDTPTSTTTRASLHEALNHIARDAALIDRLEKRIDQLQDIVSMQRLMIDSLDGATVSSGRRSRHSGVGQASPGGAISAEARGGVDLSLDGEISVAIPGDGDGDVHGDGSPDMDRVIQQLAHRCRDLFRQTRAYAEAHGNRPGFVQDMTMTERAKEYLNAVVADETRVAYLLGNPMTRVSLLAKAVHYDLVKEVLCAGAVRGFDEMVDGRVALFERGG